MELMERRGVDEKRFLSRLVKLPDFLPRKEPASDSVDDAGPRSVLGVFGKRLRIAFPSLFNFFKDDFLLCVLCALPSLLLSSIFTTRNNDAKTKLYNSANRSLLL